jgi:hypothetical protein
MVSCANLHAQVSLLQDGLDKEFLVLTPGDTIRRLAGYTPTRLARFPFLESTDKLLSACESGGELAVVALSEARFRKDYPGFAAWVAANRERLELKYAPLMFPLPRAAGSRHNRRGSTSEKGAAGQGEAGEGAARDGATSSWRRDEAGSGDDGESEESEGEVEGSVDVANDELPQIGSSMWV